MTAQTSRAADTSFDARTGEQVEELAVSSAAEVAAAPWPRRVAAPAVAGERPETRRTWLGDVAARPEEAATAAGWSRSPTGRPGSARPG